MSQNEPRAFAFELPRMVSAQDVVDGRAKLMALIEAIAPAKMAIAQAESEMLLVDACDLVEGAKGLETVTLSADMQSDGGASRVRLTVSCEYLPSDDEEDEGNIEDELHDLLDEVGSEIYNSEMFDRALEPRVFLKKLVDALLGDAAGRSWLVARRS